MSTERTEELDLVIVNGRLIDPAAGVDSPADIAIRSGRVAALQLDPGAQAPSFAARTTVDATGRIVVPGLIDMHTHVFWGGGLLGLDADFHAPTRGTTTWVDAGSSGAATFPAFERFLIERSTVRIVPFLNISAPGLPMGTRAHANVADMDPDLAAEAVEDSRGLVCGIKVLCSGPQVGSSGLTPLRVAREVADAVGLPVMCHIGAAPPGFGAVAPLLRSGDIVTHAFKGKVGCLVGAGNKIRDEAWAAKDRGVLFDVAHGQSSFSWPAAEAAFSEGFHPDTISTDLHTGCVDGPAYGMPAVMSKFLHLGMDIVEVIRLSTARPAEILGLAGEIGTLAVGSCADAAILEVEEGSYDLPDCECVVRTAGRRLVVHSTIRGGEVLYPSE